MNINAVFGLIALVIVVGGGAWLYSMSGKDGAPAAPTTEETTSATYADIMARTGSWTCTVSLSIAESPAEGTVKIADGKVRADYVIRPVALNGKAMTASFIHADGYAYTWTDLAPQGAKIAIVPGQAAPGAPDASTPVDYSCTPWIAEAASFTPPANITFIDVKAMAPTPM